MKLLKNIRFPQSVEDENFNELNKRLDNIKGQIFGKKFVVSKTERPFNIIQVDFGWAKEIFFDLGYNWSYNKDKEEIGLYFFMADTKEQGGHFYKPNKPCKQYPDEIKGFETYIDYYFAFKHFRKTITYLSIENPKNTHNYDFFKDWAGQYNIDSWDNFVTEFEKYYPNWLNNCDWIEKFRNSERTYFNFSIGTCVEVRFPYKKLQELDNDIENSNLAILLKGIIEELKLIVNK